MKTKIEIKNSFFIFFNILKYGMFGKKDLRLKFQSVIIGHDPIMTVFFNLPFPNKLTRCQNLPMGGQFLCRRFAMLNLAK